MSVNDLVDSLSTHDLLEVLSGEQFISNDLESLFAEGLFEVRHMCVTKGF